MMKIIKRGKIPEEGKKQFECKNCGTIFLAEIGEYHSLSQMAYVHDGIQYECICPVCHKKAYI